MDKVQTKITLVSVRCALFCLFCTHDDLIMQVFVWWCMVLFKTMWFGSLYMNLRQSHLCTSFKDNIFSCIQVNMAMIVYICTLCDDITCVYCIIYRGNSPFLGANTQLFKKFCPLYGMWGGSLL